MGKGSHSRIILIGFSTTGKSEAARKIASHLGWGLVDTDEEITKLTGRNIPEIFAQDGEDHFREMEQQVLAKACEKTRVVIACGGGAVIDSHNRQLMKGSGFVVCLETNPEMIYQRLLKDTEVSGNIRPLLAVPDPLERIRQLKESRQHYYAIADWTVHTDNLILEEVQQEVLRGWYYWNRADQEEKSRCWEGDLACEVVTTAAHYPVYVGWGLLQGIGQKVARAGLSGAAYLISDEKVFSIYGDTVTKSLQSAGVSTQCFVVTPGETTKTLDTAASIYDWLIDCRAERSDIVIALGGGVIGDLAGFVAATFLRGLPLVQVPTSLIAMVDAAIGGKTAVNHPSAKNLIGVFYQPCSVIADIQTLTTLDRRELVSGWAEVVKHGIVLDPELFALSETNIEKLLGLDTEITAEAIGRSVAIKARIVSEDERERGRRILLNYGHTIGHALEAATDYERFLHGEAVAVGMMGAAMLSHNLGLLPGEIVEEQRALLQNLGLPTHCSGVDMNTVLDIMELDKKVKGKAVRWVLLEGVGKPVVRDDVVGERVMEVLSRLLRD
ncbi:MAG: 3-dehydroquinate synthase [Chloroflexi bacterium RBG_13_53_26]|nr:MAG: 3-dehydroquinate synthase [Chloroflexi bacterium RBG_13_53_26]